MLSPGQKVPITVPPRSCGAVWCGAVRLARCLGGGSRGEGSQVGTYEMKVPSGAELLLHHPQEELEINYGPSEAPRGQREAERREKSRSHTDSWLVAPNYRSRLRLWPCIDTFRGSCPGHIRTPPSLIVLYDKRKFPTVAYPSIHLSVYLWQYGYSSHAWWSLPLTTPETWAGFPGSTDSDDVLLLT